MKKILSALILLATFASADFKYLENTIRAVEGPGWADQTIRVALTDSNGSSLLSLRGALNVHDADVHNVPVNEYIHFHTAVATTLSAPVTSQDTTINVTSAVGFNVGDSIEISNGIQEATFPEITLIVGTALTLDRPIDNNFSIGDNVTVVDTNMNFAGSLAAPRAFRVSPPTGQVWHIQRILISMTHGTAGDLGLFGNLAALLNGVVFRANVSGRWGTFTNWKTNADIKDDMYDVEFDTRSTGGGTYGTTGRGSFNRIGVTLRLDGDVGDFLEVLVQDNLSALLTFRIKTQGHLEE